MAAQQVKLEEADSAEIISLVDNSADFLSNSNRKDAQSAMQRGQLRSQLPVAEHGFSMFIRIKKGEKTRTILFDTGCSINGVTENAARLGVDLQEVDCIVLSHGHWDHVGGLVSAVKAIGKADLPIIVHQDMFKVRGTATQSGDVAKYPPSPLGQLANQAQLIETKQPTLVADGLAAVTGEIPRVTSYERGYGKSRIFVEGQWQPDPLILDDRALVLNVKGKGLVVVSGCAHAGIINTLKYAQKITGVETVYAVMGGFHLVGKENQAQISQTVEELKKLVPKLAAPSHCTGWRAMFAIAQALPEAFVWNSVGHLYRIINENEEKS
jgi:7,8-dihydropterin-6-yl-methyl-4-(beta-D-ribofuranosyl)aminobenzene 5'-phosphate synthase